VPEPSVEEIKFDVDDSIGGVISVQVYLCSQLLRLWHKVHSSNKFCSNDFLIHFHANFIHNFAHHIGESNVHG
jgi:hypothetical protein